MLPKFLLLKSSLSKFERFNRKGRVLVNRIDEMKTFLQETKDKLLTERLKKIEEYCQSQGKAKTEELQAIVQGLMWERRKGNLVISYLVSSIVTGSHEIFIAFYSGEPYVEEEPDGIYYSLSSFFQGIEDELLTMHKTLGNKFIRILDYEKEEIRRWYISQIYINLTSIYKIIFKDFQKESDINIYYGSFMGEIALIQGGQA